MPSIGVIRSAIADTSSPIFRALLFVGALTVAACGGGEEVPTIATDCDRGAQADISIQCVGGDNNENVHQSADADGPVESEPQCWPIDHATFSGAWSETATGATFVEEFWAPAGPTIWAFPLDLQDGSLLKSVTLWLDPQDLEEPVENGPSVSLARSEINGGTEVVYFAKVEGYDEREVDLIGGEIEVDRQKYYYTVRVQSGPLQAIRVGGPPLVTVVCP